MAFEGGAFENQTTAKHGKLSVSLNSRSQEKNSLAKMGRSMQEPNTFDY